MLSLRHEPMDDFLYSSTTTSHDGSIHYGSVSILSIHSYILLSINSYIRFN